MTWQSLLSRDSFRSLPWSIVLLPFAKGMQRKIWAKLTFNSQGFYGTKVSTVISHPTAQKCHLE